MDITKHDSVSITVSVTHPLKSAVTVYCRRGDFVWQQSFKNETSISEIYKEIPTEDEWRLIELKHCVKRQGE